MDLANYDSEIEKRAHPENFKEDTLEQAADLIDVLEDALTDLDYYSARNDDMFSIEISNIEEQIKNLRKQLI